MSPLQWGYVLTAAVCFAVSLQHAAITLRLRFSRVHALFCGTAFAAAVDALVQRRFTVAATPDEFDALFAWSAVSICSFLILFIWFIETRTNAVRRPLLVVETALLAVTGVLDFVLPAGSRATMHITEVREAVLPWGETINRAVGDPSPWRIVGDAANIGLLVLLLDTTVRLVRRDRRREAWLIGSSVMVIALSVLAIIPMDLGLIDLPSLHPFAFLLIVALMGWDLSDTVARAAQLALQVRANERRYRNLIDTSSLLIIELDREGRVVGVNPKVEEVTGRPASDFMGRQASDLAIPEDRDTISDAVSEALAGRFPDEDERPISTADGGIRVIVWRSVLLRDEHGEIEGLLSLGADVTEHREAQAARDRALGDLERSVAELDSLRRRLEEENLILKEAVEQSRTGHRHIVGDSDALLYVMHKVHHVAPTGATVLLTGETGVGKELVARAIHSDSPRASNPFVAVNCAAMPASLIESELFGHERGAFTGADRMRRGRFEQADGGTLFLDEVGELPLEVQPKLLRVLQDGSLERVGGEQTLSVDVRVIAATNRELRSEVEAGRFREDLFYRLEVYPITVPPLRDRTDDIPLLVEHFVREIGAREGRNVREIPPEVLRHLAAHDWPGNIRELRNVVERAVLASHDGVLRLVEPLSSSNGGLGGVTRDASANSRPRPTLDDIQRDYIRQVLAECDGQISGRGGAAQVLGIHPNTLRSRMHKLGIAQAAAARPGTTDGS